MTRILSTLSLAAGLCATAGLAAAADDAGISLPTYDREHCVKPAYPRSALRDEEEGVVFFGVFVDADGSVLDTKVMLSTGSEALDKATLAAFRACRYLPGKVGNRPVAMWTLIKYFWKLDPPGGRLVPKLTKEALDGSAKARFQLGVFVGKYAETEELRRRCLALEFEAAELGEPVAQISQGAMYEYGVSVAKDMEKALSWYEKAAVQGNVFAIDHLRFISAPR